MTSSLPPGSSDDPPGPSSPASSPSERADAAAGGHLQADPFDRPPAPDVAPVDPEKAAERDESLHRLRREARKSGDKKAAGRAFWKELPILILIALVVAVLIKTFLVQAFFIPSGSMHDTLLEGDRVMVNKLAYRFGDPARGDVIVFDNPQNAGDDGETIFGALVRHVAESLGLSSPDSALIKRVIAVGGETIEIRQNQVFVDGVALDEPYVKEGSRMPRYGPLTIPESHVFVMGDNRSQSTDSRVFGPIPEDSIVGKAFIRVWPPSRWGGL
ncbi:MAG: signal peptidase I [Acidimicrobiia bacterium]|nr:signal peptidase I [Acidimicrobiia bacterium]